MQHIAVDLSDEQRANLARLAAYLRALPADYPDFEMDLFTQDGSGGAGSVAHVPACGTAACAAGHGPSAGITPLPDERWYEYSKRVFVFDAGGWAWCFNAGWSRRDNTAHGAAARIEHLLTHGLPINADEQRWGEAELSYTIPAGAQ